MRRDTSTNTDDLEPPAEQHGEPGDARVLRAQGALQAVLAAGCAEDADQEHAAQHRGEGHHLVVGGQHQLQVPWRHGFDHAAQSLDSPGIPGMVKPHSPQAPGVARVGHGRPVSVDPVAYLGGPRGHPPSDQHPTPQLHSPPPMPPHPIHRRYHAEDLVRQRRAGERRRQVSSQRRGRVDPNPHQIDAVMFALRRIPEGGCILADEVGLGKTIEAGLVIAQLLAEGATRILIVVPRPLLGQWQAEMVDLFDIQAFEAADPSVDTEGEGVFLAGREYAGGGAERRASRPRPGTSA